MTMDIKETSRILAKIVSFDNRNVEEESLLSWHELLEPYNFQDALEAVRDYYRRERKWIMPADVIDRVDERQKRRLMEAGYVGANERDWSEASSVSEVSKTIMHAVSTGQMSRDQYQEYKTSDVAFTQFRRRLKAVGK